MSEDAADGYSAVWDELEPIDADSEARLLVNAIKDARRRKLDSITVSGRLSVASEHALLRKNFRVIPDARNPEHTRIEFGAGSIVVIEAGATLPSPSTTTPTPPPPPLVHVILPPSKATTPSKAEAAFGADHVSPAYRLMQQREADDARFALPSPFTHNRPTSFSRPKK
jgi:hypothetical protein